MHQPLDIDNLVQQLVNEKENQKLYEQESPQKGQNNNMI